MTFVREHGLAMAHPLKLAGEKRADAAIKRMRKAMHVKAEKLRAKANKLLDEASELSYLSTKHTEYGTVFAEKRTEIEDAAYWAARAAVGLHPRDADGEYIEPAPFWRVSYGGEVVGTYQGEERCDVLRQVCPPKTDDRRWSDFTVERIADRTLSEVATDKTWSF